MSETTKQFMRKLRSKITRFEMLVACSFGYESELAKAAQCRSEIETMVEDRLLHLENEVIRAGGRVE